MKRVQLILFVVITVFVVASAWFVYAEKTEKEEFKIQFPLGLDPDAMQIPPDNPVTKEKVELGKLLYFDKRLSKEGAVSCATCHAPHKGYTDQIPASVGFHGQTGKRNAPTVLNSAFNLFQFWDGRAPNLEEQAKGPIANPIEMANTHDFCVQTIASVKGYKPYFKAAFGDDKVTIDRIVKAIASFERTLLSGNSYYDQYVNNHVIDRHGFTESAKRGLDLFEGKALCTKCHVGFNLSDGMFHNIGVGMNKPDPDLGRYNVTHQEKDKGAFKTPILRDLIISAPYMHDGSIATLQDVIEHYDKGGTPNQWLDPQMKPLNLTKEEKFDLLNFLESMEGDWEPIEEPKLPE